MVRIGIVGKTNTGKTTFFNAATMQTAEISMYPFTTKSPNYGTGYVSIPCVCREFKVKDDPVNSSCIDGWRFIPVEIIDLPGLIKGAWMGKGLGNQFLSVASQSDVLLHMVDASGSINADGKIDKPGSGDPVRDFIDVEEEIINWFTKNIQNRMRNVEKLTSLKGYKVDEALVEVLAGMRISIHHVRAALVETKLYEKDINKWTQEDIEFFSKSLRWISKPTLIVANKMDLPTAEDNYKALVEELSELIVIPCSAEAELVLKRAEQKGLVRYVPGNEKFMVYDETKLTEKQKWALRYIEDKVLKKILNTGVQLAINTTVFKLMKMNVIYPVEDEKNLTDSSGNVLPDAILLPEGANLVDLAREIHTELAKGVLYGIDVRTGLRIPKDMVLRDRDVVKIVSTTGRSKRR